MTPDAEEPGRQIEVLQKRLARQRKAREEAEDIAERATRDLYERVQVGARVVVNN